MRLTLNREASWFHADALVTLAENSFSEKVLSLFGVGSNHEAVGREVSPELVRHEPHLRWQRKFHQCESVCMRTTGLGLLGVGMRDRIIWRTR